MEIDGQRCRSGNSGVNYMSKIEILLRSRLVRDALSSVLSAAGFFVINDPAQRDKDTIVIIDLDDRGDAEALHAHRKHGVKIVALASGTDSLEISPDEIAPLSGILTYDSSDDVFVGSLRLICAGQQVFPRDLILGQKSPARPPDAAPRVAGVRFSPRERAVLCHLVEGHSNKMIARHLGMAEATTKVYLQSLLRKIKVENRTQAAIWALSNLPKLNVLPVKNGKLV
jgi:two-component system nitrate/nitrite response regulator NarL